MTFTDKLTATPWVTIVGHNGNRYQLDLAGVSGWCWDSPNGLCIAVVIDKAPVPQWLRRVSLLLAASENALDDSILLERGKAWLIHRYPSDLEQVEQEAALTQQLAVARFLAAQGQQATITTTRPGNKQEK